MVERQSEFDLFWGEKGCWRTLFGSTRVDVRFSWIQFPDACHFHVLDLNFSLSNNVWMVNEGQCQLSKMIFWFKNSSMKIFDDSKLCVWYFLENISLVKYPKILILSEFVDSFSVYQDKEGKCCEWGETGVKTGIEPVMKPGWLWFSLRFTFFWHFSSIRSKFGEITIWL